MAPAEPPTARPPPPRRRPARTAARALAADQRYCLSCGSRVGEPRVARVAPRTTRAAAPAPRGGAAAQADCLAARGGDRDRAARRDAADRRADRPWQLRRRPAPVVQVARPARRPPRRRDGDQRGGPGTITSEWPAGTDGFTIQLSTVAKARRDARVGRRRQADRPSTSGAADAAVLDSDLYSSLPPGNYVIYSGVYTDRKSAEVALKGLGKQLSVGDRGRGLGRAAADRSPRSDRRGGTRRLTTRAGPPAGGEARSRRHPEPTRRRAEATEMSPARSSG